MSLSIRKIEEKISNDKRRILILGADGYIGVALYYYLENQGFTVMGVDNSMRERNVINIGSDSLTFASKPADIKLDISEEQKGRENELTEIVRSFGPEVIVNLAQQSSAPFSMASSKNALETQRNNICGGLNVLWAVKEANPDINVIQLGTAGEYSDWLYGDIEVPEGSRIDVKYNGKDWTIPTPRYAGSWYHFSKLHSSYNADYACRIWGLKVTDINQGIVYGHLEHTRFDYDEYFGTVINRFVAQAVAGIPLTIYGEGGQTRSFIHLKNSIQAIELLINNPPITGEYRIIQQLTDVKSVWQIAKMVQAITDCEIQKVDNPRVEMSSNNFNFEALKLKTLGLKPVDMETEIRILIKLVEKYKDNIRKEVIMPTVHWI